VSAGPAPGGQGTLGEAGGGRRQGGGDGLEVWRQGGGGGVLLVDGGVVLDCGCCFVWGLRGG
jgi:hypothetical protein